MKPYSIRRLEECPQAAQMWAKWFHARWGVPEAAYRESMEQCLRGEGAVPQWYAVLDGARIIGGAGVIENDFHDRRDLAPNVCAVYVEEACRGQGIAGELLRHICRDMKARGIDTLYLLTDHMSFYERYGWTFYTMAKNEGEESYSRLYIHKET